MRCDARLPVLQVYPSSNPLDQKDFNPIDYINELFPSEQVQLWVKLLSMSLIQDHTHLLHACGTPNSLISHSMFLYEAWD